MQCTKLQRKQQTKSWSWDLDLQILKSNEAHHVGKPPVLLLNREKKLRGVQSIHQDPPLPAAPQIEFTTTPTKVSSSYLREA